MYKKTKTLVFVEVKLRRGTGFGDPLEAVTPRETLVKDIDRTGSIYLVHLSKRWLLRTSEE